MSTCCAMTNSVSRDCRCAPMCSRGLHNVQQTRSVRSNRFEPHFRVCASPVSYSVISENIGTQKPISFLRHTGGLNIGQSVTFSIFDFELEIVVGATFFSQRSYMRYCGLIAG